MVTLMKHTKETMVKDWNEKYSIGQKVLAKDGSTQIEATTASEAMLLGGSTPVIILKEFPGVYALDIVTAVTE